MKKGFFTTVGLALAAVLQGCGGGTSSTVGLALTDQPNCPDGQNELWSTLYAEVSAGSSLPTAGEIESEVRASTRTRVQADALLDAYEALETEVRGLPRDEALARLAQMEIGDRTSAEKVARQDGVDAKMATAQRTSVEAMGECTSAPPNPFLPIDPVPLFEEWRETVPAPLYGAYKAISVGYQSCNVVGIAPMTSASASVQGITVTGTAAGGVGLTREVNNVSEVFATNPFYDGRVSPPTGCFSSADSPMIYDYGGKPYTTGSGAGTIDFTKNAGSGTDALGVDCSGFVTTAILVGGLRLKSGVASNAAQSGGVNAAMYASPVTNGLSCFSPLTSTTTEDLQSGDIAANTGHVIMIDQTGVDPLGIANAKTSADCDAVSSTGFNFTIIQSSASSGGIGMNRYRATDYLATDSLMRTGLEEYARSFCRVRLGLASPSTLSDTANAVVIRHSNSAACFDTPVAVVGSACLMSCTPLTAESI